MRIATQKQHPDRQIRTSREHGRRLMRTGWWVILGALVPLGVWIGFAPLSMAVVAHGTVKVDLNRRPVQHLEGGIVREVFVRDGQHVDAGEPVLLLGDVRIDADRNRLEYRLHVESAALARLEAEQSFAKTLVFPEALHLTAQHDRRVEEALLKERAVFNARRGGLDSEVALMHAQRQRIEQEVAALQAQIQQAQNSLALQTQELDTNRKLLTRGLIARTKLTQMESAVADYAARLEERRSELARARQRLVDSDLRIKSTQNQYVQMASDQLKMTASRLTEIEQELRKLTDAAMRQVVVAPAMGEVMELKFTSPGAVVHPGEPIAEIVPSDARLVIEAYIQPNQINHVHREQRVRIRFTAFKYRSTAIVMGKVMYVSADRLVEPASHMPYYSVMILVDAESLHAAGDLKLQAGMPAEVFLEGATVTPLQYLMEPVTSTLRGAGREI